MGFRKHYECLTQNFVDFYSLIPTIARFLLEMGLLEMGLMIPERLVLRVVYSRIPTSLNKLSCSVGVSSKFYCDLAVPSGRKVGVGKLIEICFTLE